MDYFFGSAPEPRHLRCRIGPTQNVLCVADINDSPTFIDSPVFCGNILLRIKNYKKPTEEAPSSIEYFNGKRRLFSLQISGRFKKEFSAEDIVFGTEFDKKVLPPTGAWVAMKFAALIDPALQNDLYAERPWLFSPILCAMNTVNVSLTNNPMSNPAEPVAVPHDDAKESDSLLTPWIWKNGYELNEDSTHLFPDSTETPPFANTEFSERRKYFQRDMNRQSFMLKTDRIYNMEIFAPFIDFNTFDLTLGVNLNLVKYLNKQPIRLMAKIKSTNETLFICEFDLIDSKGHGLDSMSNSQSGSQFFDAPEQS